MSFQKSLNNALSTIAYTRLAKRGVQAFQESAASSKEAAAAAKETAKTAQATDEKYNQFLEQQRINLAMKEQAAKEDQAIAEGYMDTQHKHEWETVVDKLYSQEEKSAFGDESIMKRYTELHNGKTGLQERREILSKFASPYVIGRLEEDRDGK